MTIRKPLPIYFRPGTTVIENGHVALATEFDEYDSVSVKIARVTEVIALECLNTHTD